MSEALAIAPTRRRAPVGEALAGLLLSLPAGLAFLLMLALPTFATILLAFTDYELGMTGWNWIGLENFAELIDDRGFAVSLRNTLIYVGLVAPLSIALGLGAALLIEAGMRGRAFFRAVFFLPVVSLTVAMAAAWQYLLHPTIGPLNAALRALGVASPPFWLSSSDWVLLSLSAIGIWENLGYNMVLFLAGLTAIPRELHQAAEVDGARAPLDRFLLVTWPPIVPGLLQRIEHEARMCRARRAPADDAPRIGIDDEGDVDEAGPGRHIGEVRHPQRIRARCLELAIDVVLRTRGRLVADRGSDRLAADDALQTHGLHQARHCALGNRVAFAQQLAPDLAHAIDAEVLLEHPRYLRHQRGIAPGPRTLPGRVAAAGGMRVVGGWGDRQQLADRLDPMCLAMIVDEGDHGLNRHRG